MSWQSILSLGFMLCLVFYFGVVIGARITSLPSLKDTLKKKTATKEMTKEQEALNVMMMNVDNYDGTGENQIDVPR